MSLLEHNIVVFNSVRHQLLGNTIDLTLLSQK